MASNIIGPRRTWRSEAFATVLGVAGFAMLAVPNLAAAWGFIALLSSSAAWAIFSVAHRHWGLLTQSLCILGGGSVGLWHWWLGPMTVGFRHWPEVFLFVGVCVVLVFFLCCYCMLTVASRADEADHDLVAAILREPL